MNLDQTVTIQNFEQQLQSLLNKLHAEIDFTGKSLDINKQDFIKSFTASLTDFKNSLQKFETILQQADMHHKQHVQNLATLTLLPEKVAGNITELVPKIAESLGNIYQPHIIETKNQFTVLKQELEQGINNFHNKMLELSSQTMQESILISTSNRNKFVKTIAIMVIFSAVVASVTSYFVVNSFPRYISIQGASGLSIRDSRIVIHDSSEKIKEMKPTKGK